MNNVMCKSNIKKKNMGHCIVVFEHSKLAGYVFNHLRGSIIVKEHEKDPLHKR